MTGLEFSTPRPRTCTEWCVQAELVDAPAGGSAWVLLVALAEGCVVCEGAVWLLTR